MDRPADQRSSPAASRSPAGGHGAESPTVLYVMGAGRSGSTILGVTLGNCEGVFYAGELDKWLLRAGVSPLAGEERVRFWGAVRARMAEHLGDDADMRAMRLLERSSGLFRLRGRPGRRVRERYRRLSADLYRAVSAVAKATHVVDSSHYPRRARQLQLASDVDLYLILLVRDPQRVIASWSRDDVAEPQFGVLRTNAYLWLTHVLSLLVFLRQRRDRRLLLRHEDLLADPEGMLDALLERIDAASPPPDLSALAVGVPFQANRLARAEVVALDRRGAAAQRRRSWTTAVLQLPWSVVFALLRPTLRSPRTAQPAPRHAELAPGRGG